MYPLEDAWAAISARAPGRVARGVAVSAAHNRHVSVVEHNVHMATAASDARVQAYKEVLCTGAASNGFGFMFCGRIGFRRPLGPPVSGRDGRSKPSHAVAGEGRSVSQCNIIPGRG